MILQSEPLRRLHLEDLHESEKPMRPIQPGPKSQPFQADHRFRALIVTKSDERVHGHVDLAPIRFRRPWALRTATSMWASMQDYATSPWSDLVAPVWNSSILCAIAR
jgi:hypothetical protein